MPTISPESVRRKMKKQDFESCYDEENQHVPYRVRLAIGAGNYMAKLSNEKAYTLYQFSMQKYAELLASLDEKVDAIFSLDTKAQSTLDALLSECGYDWVEAFGAALISRDDDDAPETLRWVLEHSPLPQSEFAKIYG